MATDEPNEPEASRRQEEIDKALAAIHEFRKRTRRITLAELLSARDEGRKS
jgi:hypothetical protein